MNWLVLSYLISLGTLSNYVQVDDIPRDNRIIFEEPANAFSTTLAVELLAFEHIFVGGSVTTWEVWNEWLSFCPNEALYGFSAGVRFGPFELGVRHECDHSVVTGGGIDNLTIGGNKTEVYVKLEGKVNLL
jgi:hypothetical protein